jgi:hypothetical protein
MRLSVLIPFLLLGVGACGRAPSTTTTPAPSTVSGSAALSSFPAAPSSVTATDESGRSVRSAVAADGRFSLALAKGHTYKLAVTTPKGDVPLVFPRTTGKLKRTFALLSDGAAVQLGSVRYLGKAPVGGFHVMSVRSATADGGAAPDGASGEVADIQETKCEGGGAEEKGAEKSAPESESAPEAPEAKADATPGADASEEADANSEMAVGDQNAPDQVAGCSGGADGDNLQQEGEH